MKASTKHQKHPLVEYLIVWIFVFVGTSSSKPNVIILFADDLGYGDLGAYGHPTSSTPNLNKLAKDGLLFTQFYSSSAVCSPSRAALLTGRYQTRSGVYPGVFEADCTGGLPHNETTIAEVLKSVGYHTAMVGKWHLGVGKGNKYVPTTQGFDEYFGIPYTHGGCPCYICFYPNDPCLLSCKDQYVPCPIFNGTDIIEQPANLTVLHDRYITRVKEIIRDNAAIERPFFLYYAFHHTHHPNFAGEKYRNSSIRGPYGDSLAELDDGVGEVIDQLQTSGILNNTFVFFSSDNGACLHYKQLSGNSGLLKCGKGTTYEGGHRVPAIAYWPHSISPGRTHELASTLDLLPTIANIVGAPLPQVTLDGFDIRPVLFGEGKSPREIFFYYPPHTTQEIGLNAVRYKQYKAHFYTEGSINSGLYNHDHDCRPTAKRTFHDPPLLFDLHHDPSEQFDLSTDTAYASVIAEIIDAKEAFEENMTFGVSQINQPHSPDVEPCCSPGCSPFPQCCQCANHWIVYGSHRDHYRVIYN